jgi:hypothetical protein
LTDAVLAELTFTPTNSFDATRLESMTPAQIASGENILYFEDTGEFMAVETITDNGDGTYTLENVWRAVHPFDSVPAPHSAGGRVWFFTYGRLVTSTEYADPTATRTKILPRTVSNVLALGAATSINLTTVGRAIRPNPVRGVEINGDYLTTQIDELDDLAVVWIETNRLSEGAVVKQTDTGVEPEATTTYTIKFFQTEVGISLLRTESGIVASTGTQTATMTVAEEEASPNYLGHLAESYRVEIQALRGGEISTTYIRDVARAPNETVPVIYSVVVDGEPVEVDGEPVVVIS